ncbi:DUF2490 domain-containing protein [Flavobacterium saliperosum]|uniref:Intein C-terminal splicing region n=2 Tax=Flavobacterium saliperosum TaxID=329186 RepID=A0A1G4W7U3_9FLAO|nr:DUF2490 domain-containing protein [Flavobacterium saliperosum]SCX18195.1 Protein of unknown function [Flavobacterium saliperosum]
MKYLFLLLFIPIHSFSQKNDVGNWLMYFGNQKINERFNWHNEIQYRNYNFVDDLQQLLLRTGVGYNLTENNNTILLGYGYIHSQNYVGNTSDKVKTNEHRVFQQYITRQNFGRVFMQHRYRIEERFLSDDFQMRLRYQLGFNIPINNKTMVEKTFYASAYNEIFINTQNTFFDRNRLYGALGYVINKNLKVEAGFMAQTLENTNRNQFQIALFNNLPFNNPKN